MPIHLNCQLLLELNRVFKWIKCNNEALHIISLFRLVYDLSVICIIDSVFKLKTVCALTM